MRSHYPYLQTLLDKVHAGLYVAGTNRYSWLIIIHLSLLSLLKLSMHFIAAALLGVLFL